MTENSLGVAVIGAGMVGRAHAAGYRVASQLYDLDLPEIRLVAVADAYEPFAVDAARRFGYQRPETSWQAIVEAADIDVVSVAIANELHRPVVEALLAAGKHVLCEKPLAPSVEDAEAMVAAAEAADTQSGVGFTFRRTPGINAIREQLDSGAIGEVRHFNGHYWCDYAQNPNNPMSWRYQGGPGSGALADIGSHMIDLGEYLCGPIASGQRCGVPDVHHRTPGAPRRRRGARRGGSRRRQGAGRERGHRHLHRDVRNPARSAPSRSAASRTAFRTDSASRSSRLTAPPPSTSTGPGSSPSPTTVRTGRPTATAPC